MEFCKEHSEVKVLVHRNIKDISELNQKDIDVNKRVDNMKNWVIAGMSSLILNLIIVISGIIMIYLKVQ